jgi:hypothetical protein
VAPEVLAPVVPPALPPFERCLAAASAGEETGIDALAGLSGPLEQDCPELAMVLQSTAVRTVLQTYARQDAEAARQQTSLMREATLANSWRQA